MEEFNLYEEMFKIDQALLEMIKEMPELAEILAEELYEPNGPIVTLPRAPTHDEWLEATRR